MVFAHDSETSLQVAVELVNSTAEPTTLTTVAELDDLFTRYGFTGRHDRTAAELAEVRALIPRLRQVLLAEPDDAVGFVNAFLDEVTLKAELVSHDESGWHLHAVDSDRPLAERIKVETAMAMVEVIRADETSRLSVCADGACDGIVLDLSRNRSRRYCSTTCGNRNAVAAYRARRAD